MTVKGIDVSSYQSSTFSTSGLSFVFVKATEGTSYISSTQSAQAAHARAAGCVVGFYHFMHLGNPKGQAAYFVEKCVSQVGDILACDWEPTSSGTPSNADKDTFIKEVKRLRPGHKVVLYCDVSRWTGVDKTSYCGDGLWIADPNHAAGKPGIQHAWTFHQYGISGTDQDVASFSSKAALKAWATGSTPPPNPTPEDDDMTPAQAAQLAELHANLLTIKRVGPIAKKDAINHSAGYYLAEGEARAHEASIGVTAIEGRLDALEKSVTALVVALTPKS
jgi:hypothetical protein